MCLPVYAADTKTPYRHTKVQPTSSHLRAKMLLRIGNGHYKSTTCVMKESAVNEVFRKVADKNYWHSLLVFNITQT